MATGFLKISSNGNKILKSALMTAPSIMIFFFSIFYRATSKGLSSTPISRILISKELNGSLITVKKIVVMLQMWSIPKAMSLLSLPLKVCVRIFFDRELRHKVLKVCILFPLISLFTHKEILILRPLDHLEANHS